MIKVGLSGNRFSGKTEVCNMFRRLSIPVFDADVVLRFIIHHDMSVNKQIRDKLSELYGTSGNYVSPIFARTKEEIDIILLHAQHDLFRAYEIFSEKNKSSIYTIFKSSVLFEREWNKLMNYNISVFAPKITRMERFQESTKKKVSDVAFILKNEIDDLDKNKMANFVVHSYKGRDIRKQVHEIDQFVIDSYLAQETPSRISNDGKGIILTHF